MFENWMEQWDDIAKLNAYFPPRILFEIQLLIIKRHLPSSRASSNGVPIIIFSKYGHFKATGIKTTTTMMAAGTTATITELSENIETLNSVICKKSLSDTLRDA